MFSGLLTALLGLGLFRSDLEGWKLYGLTNELEE